MNRIRCKTNGQPALAREPKHDLVAFGPRRDAEAGLKEPDKCVGIVGTKIATDYDCSRGAVTHRKLAAVGAIELGDDITERHFQEFEPQTVPSERTLHLGGGDVVDPHRRRVGGTSAEN